FVKVQRVLRDTAQRLHADAAVGKESSQKLRVASAVGEAGESEMSPRAYVPSPVAIVDDLHGSSIRPREVLVKSRAAPERIQRRPIVAVLGVEGDAGKRQVIVPCCWARIAVLAPVAVGGLLLRRESVHHVATELFPLTVSQDTPGEIDGRGPE